MFFHRTLVVTGSIAPSNRFGVHSAPPRALVNAFKKSLSSTFPRPRSSHSAQNRRNTAPRAVSTPRSTASSNSNARAIVSRRVGASTLPNPLRIKFRNNRPGFSPARGRSASHRYVARCASKFRSTRAFLAALRRHPSTRRRRLVSRRRQSSRVVIIIATTAHIHSSVSRPPPIHPSSPRRSTRHSTSSVSTHRIATVTRTSTRTSPSRGRLARPTRGPAAAAAHVPHAGVYPPSNSEIWRVVTGRWGPIHESRLVAGVPRPGRAVSTARDRPLGRRGARGRERDSVWGRDRSRRRRARPLFHPLVVTGGAGRAARHSRAGSSSARRPRGRSVRCV